MEQSPNDAAHRTEPTGERAGGQRPAVSATRAEAEADLEAALEAARAGDERGFATVWRALHPPLLRYLAVRSGEAAEDVAAETWLHVIRDLADFEGGAAAFRGWLFTLARHRAIDQGRARAARPSYPVADPGGASPAPLAPSAADAAEDRAATQAALRLVATLPADQAELVLLRVVAGLDVATVAAMVGRSPGAVRVAVHRALRSLSQNPQIHAPREVV